MIDLVIKYMNQQLLSITYNKDLSMYDKYDVVCLLIRGSARLLRGFLVMEQVALCIQEKFIIVYKTYIALILRHPKTINYQNIINVEC